MKKLLSAVVLVLSILMITPIIMPQTNEEVQAAWKKKIVIAVNEKYQLPNKKGMYSSFDDGIISMTEKGVITGKKGGTSKIGEIREVKGKEKVVGYYTIVVKQAKIKSSIKSKANMLTFTTQTGYYVKNPRQIKLSECVKDVNKKAKYYFYTDFSGLELSETGTITNVKFEGTAKITVKEVFNGKTRTVGIFPVKLADPVYVGKMQRNIYVGDDFYYIYDSLENTEKFHFSYYDHIPTLQDRREIPGNEKTADWFGAIDNFGDDVIELDKIDGVWNGIIHAKGFGQRFCLIRAYNYLTDTYDKILGQVIIDVPDTTKLTAIRFPWDTEFKDTYEDEDGDGEPDGWDYYDDKSNCVMIFDGDVGVYLTLEPLHYSGKLEVTSSNPKMVKAKLTEMDGEPYVILSQQQVLTGKIGTATITIKGDGRERSFDVEVLPWDWFLD